MFEDILNTQHQEPIEKSPYLPPEDTITYSCTGGCGREITASKKNWQNVKKWTCTECLNKQYGGFVE